MTAAVIGLFYKTHKYYMWHKHMANELDNTESFAKAEAIAQRNKRNFGYNTRYNPTLETSRKRIMYNELGGNRTKLCV